MTFEHFEYFLHFDYIEANFDHLKDSLGDLTFETLITILTIAKPEFMTIFVI